FWSDDRAAGNVLRCSDGRLHPARRAPSCGCLFRAVRDVPLAVGNDRRLLPLRDAPPAGHMGTCAGTSDAAGRGGITIVRIVRLCYGNLSSRSAFSSARLDRRFGDDAAWNDATDVGGAGVAATGASPAGAGPPLPKPIFRT